MIDMELTSQQSQTRNQKKIKQLQIFEDEQNRSHSFPSSFAQTWNAVLRVCRIESLALLDPSYCLAIA